MKQRLNIEVISVKAKQEKSTKMNAGTGLTPGAGVGLIFGQAIFENPGLGLVFGAGTGLFFGAALFNNSGKSQNKNDEDKSW